jgi:hypothetical protein
MIKFLNVYKRGGHVEKSVGLVIFWEKIAFFMMPLKGRWRKWKEWEKEEHNSLIIWETEEEKEEAEDRKSWKRQFIDRT